MASKVVNGIIVAVGIVVLAVLAFIVVGVIGEGLAAIFGHAGFQGGSARAIGGGVAIVAALGLLAVFLWSRRRNRPAAQLPGHRSHRKHAA